MVVGSGHIFSDKYLGSECNDQFSDIIFDFLTGNNISLNALDAEDPEVVYHVLLFTSIGNFPMIISNFS